MRSERGTMMKDYLSESSSGVEPLSSKSVSGSSAKYLSLLLVGKLLKSLGIFLAYDLLKRIHLVQLLFFSLCVSSVLYVLAQRPFRSVAATAGNKRLGRFQYMRLAKYAFVQTAVELMWLFGLTLCGPLRTTLLFEQSEFVIICALKALFLSQTNPARTRGVLVLFTATLILFAFDFDHISRRAQMDQLDAGQNQQHGIFSYIFSFFISWLDISDHKGGVLLLVIALFIQIGFDHSSFARVLLTDVGGPKRLKALSTVFSTVIIAPWAIFNIFAHTADPIQHDLVESAIVQTEPHSWLYYVLPIIFMTLFMNVLDFYLDVFVSQKADSTQAAKYGSIFVFTWSALLSLVWNHPHIVVVIDKIKTVIEEEHALSVGVVIAYFLFIIATNMLSKPLSRQRGSFIGYSSVGNPLYSLTGEAHKTSASMLTVARNIMREVIANADSKKIFYFLCLNLAFTFVELSYGALANSLGLVSDGIHMLFDCSALVMGLLAAVISQWKPTRIYSYGFARVEILAGFVNGLFLVVISIFIFIEAVERLIEPPEIKSGKLLYVSFVGLCVNLFGIFAFSHAHLGAHHHSHSSHAHSHSHSHSHHGHSHHHSHSGRDQCTATDDMAENDNMRAVFLHVLADTMGSVGVIISSLLIQQFGWYLADPLCSICISVMIFLSVLPLLRHSSGLLLLRMPAGEKGRLYKALLARILSIDGVISYRDERLWQLSSSSYISTLHVQISQNAYEQLISSQSILKEMKLANLTVQLEKATFFQHLSGLGASMGQIDESKSVFKSSASLIDYASSSIDLVNVEKFV